MEFIKPTAEEFDTIFQDIIRVYGDALFQYQELFDHNRAFEKAAEEIALFLPDGYETQQSYFYKIVISRDIHKRYLGKREEFVRDSVDEIGHIWFLIKKNKDTKQLVLSQTNILG